MTKVTEINGHILDLVLLGTLGREWNLGGGDLTEDKSGISDWIEKRESQEKPGSSKCFCHFCHFCHRYYYLIYIFQKKQREGDKVTKVTEFNGDTLDLVILSALGHGWIFGGGDLVDDKSGISDWVRNVSDARNL